jgi:hypothetical protein
LVRKHSKQRLYAGLLFVGASILLYRTVAMVVGGSLGILAWWVSLLLVAELLIDLGCASYSAAWWISNDARMDRIPLRLGATAAILHAVRVAVFVIGRVGPWINFDVRPEHRALHHTRWDLGQVYFAALMSILGVIGVVVIWRHRRRARTA